MKKDTEDWNALHWCCASPRATAEQQIEIAELLLGCHTSILRQRDARASSRMTWP